jgi:phosphatidate phosphatase APP1
VIRPDEQVVFFPTLARPIGGGRWEARLHGVLFRPEEGSFRRKLLVRAIARAAGVRHDEVAGPRLAERLRPFLVDNKRRRRIRVVIGGQEITLGPSAANGHLVGRAVIGGAGSETVEFAQASDEDSSRRFTGSVHLLPETGLSVISDIDDTIKHSNVPDTRDLLRNTFLRPFRPIARVAAMHRELRDRGAAFHYVSASPWQLYGALSAFVAGEGLPAGSFHLKTFRPKDRSGLSLFSSPRLFKVRTIEPLLRAWPRRRFLLVGDSAELDAEIYGELARHCPRQVAGILIRDITGDRRGGERYKVAFASVPKSKWDILNDGADWLDAVARVLGRGSRRVR